jgi:hypothetical protein
LLGRLQEASSLNDLLTGSELRRIAGEVAALAERLDAVVVPADNIGDRIIGAALALHDDRCRPMLQNSRAQDLHVLLVSGAVAGPVGLTQGVHRMRSLGAQSVHLAVLGEPPAEIDGCDSLTSLRANDPVLLRCAMQ